MILIPNIFTSLLHEKDDYLDFLLSRCIKSGLKKVEQIDEFYALATFNNGIKYNYWNTCKYFAWLADGKIGEYEYQEGRPSRRTMRKFREILIKYDLDKIKQEKAKEIILPNTYNRFI